MSILFRRVQGRKTIPCVKMELTECFRPLWTQDERKKVLGLLSTMKKIFKENNIGYFIFYGTLLGAIRHKGLIPWDDDTDVVISTGDKEYLLTLTHVLEEHRVGICPFYGGLKFYYTDTPLTHHVEGYLHSWPFIDLFVYTEINATICLKNPDGQEISFTRKGIVIQGLQPFSTSGNPQEYYDREDIFPLQKIRFEKTHVWVPIGWKKLLGKIYSKGDPFIQVVAPKWNHKNEQLTGYPQDPVDITVVEELYRKEGWKLNR